MDDSEDDPAGGDVCTTRSTGGVAGDTAGTAAGAWGAGSTGRTIAARRDAAREALYFARSW
jgi:hypothetical protein